MPGPLTPARAAPVEQALLADPCIADEALARLHRMAPTIISRLRQRLSLPSSVEARRQRNEQLVRQELTADPTVGDRVLGTRLHIATALVAQVRRTLGLPSAKRAQAAKQRAAQQTGG